MAWRKRTAEIIINPSLPGTIEVYRVGWIEAIHLGDKGAHLGIKRGKIVGHPKFRGG